uniref:Secreted protein n=1 Tax=Arundo donax TaxID=35708 RepID=A0A0A8YT10_ARUDO
MLATALSCVSSAVLLTASGFSSSLVMSSQSHTLQSSCDFPLPLFFAAAAADSMQVGQYHFTGTSSIASLRHETWYAASHPSQMILPSLSAFFPQSLQV